MSALQAIGLGAISGLRSASGPAFVSRAASQGGLDLDGTFLSFLGSPILSKVLLVAELGEIVGDKLPMTPGRTTLPPLLGRAASGALVGAAVFLSEGRRTASGAAFPSGLPPLLERPSREKSYAGWWSGSPGCQTRSSRSPKMLWLFLLVCAH